jgi:eukaryotic-like serine/threonine-protein kinase
MNPRMSRSATTPSSGRARSGLAALFRWGSVPGTPEEVRAFLQRRVSIYLGFATLLWGAGALVSSTMILLQERDALSGANAVRTALHFLAPALMAVMWAVCRRGRRSLSWLTTAELVTSVLQGLVLGVMIYAAHPLARFRPDLALLLALTWLVVARAAVVPGTPTRTMVFGLVTCVPVCVGTWLMYRQAFAGGGGAGFYPSPDTSPATFTGWVAFLSVFSVAVSGFVSGVIYGLQRAVQQARQLGQYTLEARIGAGGMGTVFRARHALLRRPTAIKLLARDRHGPENVARFEREVQITSQLSHPNTIAIYDYGRTPDDLFYYAMEYLDGLDLETLVRGDGPQPPARVRHLLRQVLGALAEAHARGLIHRDVKPSNVMLCERGLIPDFVKVLDFGLVRDFNKGGDDVVLTGAGALTGTPLYMSPEMIRGEPLDARSDLYAVGALGYHLLAGRPVFTATTAVEIWAHHLHTAPEVPSKHLGRPLPGPLEALLISCLHKDPARRPADASALLAALDAIPGLPEWTAEDARRWWRERGVQVRDHVRGARERPCAPGAETVAVSMGSRLAG